MRTIERSTVFKRDYKREAKVRHRATLDADLMAVLSALVSDKALEARYRDHDLVGAWAGYRDGGARTLIAYRAREKIFFTFKKFAEELLVYTEQQLKQSIENGALREIKKGSKEK